MHAFTCAEYDNEAALGRYRDAKGADFRLVSPDEPEVERVAIGQSLDGLVVAQQALAAAAASGERLCVFPMDEDYDEALESPVERRAQADDRAFIRRWTPLEQARGAGLRDGPYTCCATSAEGS